MSSPSVSTPIEMLLMTELLFSFFSRQFSPTGKEFCTVTMGKPLGLACDTPALWKMTHILEKDMVNHLCHPAEVCGLVLLVLGFAT